VCPCENERMTDKANRRPISRAGTARRCAFCGRRADSSEHAWPDWLLSLLGRGPKYRYDVERRLDDRAPLKWSGSRVLTVKRVCRSCNNGWMSDLETQAQPILTRLVRGDRPLSLDPAQQATIAAWCRKTAMVFDCTRPREPYYRFDWRTALVLLMLEPRFYYLRSAPRT
jgi:hypothetical protein